MSQLSGADLPAAPIENDARLTRAWGMRGKQRCSFRRRYIKLAPSAHTYETHLSNQLALTPSRIAAWSIGET